MDIKQKTVYVILSLLHFIFLYLLLNTSSFPKEAYQGVPLYQLVLGSTYYDKGQYKQALSWYKKAVNNKSYYSEHIIIKNYLEFKK